MQARWQQLASAGQLVIALDLDGTLLPFAPTPEEARLDGDTAALIAALAASPGVHLGIISGRPLRAGPGPAAAVPERGVRRRARRVAVPRRRLGGRAARDAAARRDRALAAAARSAATRARWSSASRARCACTGAGSTPARHDAIAAAAETVVDEWLETHQQFERLPEVLALEVRHRAAHKGGALGWLRGLRPGGRPGARARRRPHRRGHVRRRCASGDVGILVSPQSRRTQASLRLPDPAGVHRFLRWLIEARSEAWRAEAAAFGDPDVLVITRPPHRPAEPRLIVASNRLPPAPSNGRQREVGGLVSALLPVLSETDGIWLGWSGAERDPGLRLRDRHRRLGDPRAVRLPADLAPAVLRRVLQPEPVAAAPRLSQPRAVRRRRVAVLRRGQPRLRREGAGGRRRRRRGLDPGLPPHAGRPRAPAHPATTAGSGSTSTSRSRRSTTSRPCRGPAR